MGSLTNFKKLFCAKKNIMQNNFSKYTFFFLAFACCFTACEDIVDLELEEGRIELVVDAWISNDSSVQEIRLRNTAPYFANAAAPAVTGATVNVTDSQGNSFNFEDRNNQGNYTWIPAAGSVFGTIGETYTLTIQSADITYTASATLFPTVPVDSITYEFREESLGVAEGYYAQFFGRDIPGLGNTYWIKTYKNGNFLNKPQEINIAYDAGPSAGAEVDGLIFITPIREAINRFPDTGDDATDDFSVPPYMLGDTIRVEIYSIPNEAFNYLERARTQLTLGDATLFAEPPSNIPTNIESSMAGESPQGFFVVSAVSNNQVVIE